MHINVENGQLCQNINVENGQLCIYWSNKFKV